MRRDRDCPESRCPAVDDALLEDFRQDAVRLVALGVLALAALYDVWLGAVPARRPAQPWPLDVAMLLVGIAALALAGRGPRLAGLALSGGLLLLIAGASILHPGYPIACAGALVVVLVGTLYGWRAGIGGAAAASAVILGLSRLPAPAVGPAAAETALLLCWLSVGLAWLGARPVDAALQWAHFSHLRELRAVGAARERQAELARLNRSLRDACEQLEIANRELERARRAAVRARVLRDRFAATVSHEMRTPLNLIIGFSEVMVESPEVYYGERLPRSYEEDLRAIYRNACHLSQLVNDILDLARIEAEHLALEKSWCSLAEIINEAVLVSRGLCETKGLFLRVEVPADLPPVLVDRTRIRQILINLLSNAARFTRAGGITIGARETEHDVLVWVRDTGAGIPREYLEQIFDEFAQAETPLRREVGGTGLGLTISKRLAELHGGNLWAESVPGQGSTFTFTLPKQTNVAASPTRPDWEPWVRLPTAREGGRTVLALTGARISAQLLQRYLEGYRVVPAATARQAERLARRLAPAAAVVVTADGPPVAPAPVLPDLPADLPVIHCLVERPAERDGLPGVHAYLTKPITRAQLRASLRGLPAGITSCLVVDDDPDVTRLIARMLRSLRPSWEVRTADGGAAALAVLQDWRPGLVLLDLIMPGVDGQAVLRAMRAEDGLRETPVIIISAVARDEAGPGVTGFTVRAPRGLGVTGLLRYLKASLDALTADSPAAGARADDPAGHGGPAG